MAEGVNVRFGGELQRFIQSKAGNSWLYGSASEHTHDLVRRVYVVEEGLKWAWLRQELKTGADVDESEFVALDADSLLEEAKSLNATHGNQDFSCRQVQDHRDLELHGSGLG